MPRGATAEGGSAAHQVHVSDLSSVPLQQPQQQPKQHQQHGVAPSHAQHPVQQQLDTSHVELLQPLSPVSPDNASAEMPPAPVPHDLAPKAHPAAPHSSETGPGSCHAEHVRWDAAGGAADAAPTEWQSRQITGTVNHNSGTVSLDAGPVSHDGGTVSIDASMTASRMDTAAGRAGMGQRQQGREGRASSGRLNATDGASMTFDRLMATATGQSGGLPRSQGQARQQLQQLLRVLGQQQLRDFLHQKQSLQQQQQPQGNSHQEQVFQQQEQQGQQGQLTPGGQLQDGLTQQQQPDAVSTAWPHIPGTPSSTEPPHNKLPDWARQAKAEFQASLQVLQEPHDVQVSHARVRAKAWVGQADEMQVAQMSISARCAHFQI